MSAIINDIKHEIGSIDRNSKSVRKFDIYLTIFLLLIAGYLFYKSNLAWRWWGLAGGLAAFLTWIRPMILFPIYYALTFVSIIIGYFVSKLILTTLFVIFFVPVGIFTRLIRKDLLDKRLDKNATSYWLKRKPVPFSKENYERLF